MIEASSAALIGRLEAPKIATEAWKSLVAVPAVPFEQPN